MFAFILPTKFCETGNLTTSLITWYYSVCEDAFISLDTDLLFSLLCFLHSLSLSTQMQTEIPVKVTPCHSWKPFMVYVSWIMIRSALNVKFTARLKPIHFSSIGAVKSKLPEVVLVQSQLLVLLRPERKQQQWPNMESQYTAEKREADLMVQQNGHT